MTQRRTAHLAVACTLILVAISPVFAQTANKVNLTTGTFNSAISSMAIASGLSDAVSAAGASRKLLFHRRYRRRSSSYRRSSHALPSRGIVSSVSAAPSVVGRLAIVTTDNASIRAGRDRYNRVLSIVPKGQYLAINTENATQYGVLMIDHSVGYVSKSDVQMLDYQVVSNTSPSATGSSSAGGTLGQQMVQTAQGYLGVPYVWGGNTRNGIDCSGFVKAVYSQYGINLPRHSGDQANVGYDVPRDNLSAWVPGDRMYFAFHGSEIDHTAMYIGNGLFIHASVCHSSRTVAIDRADDPYFYRRLVAVRRSKELLGEPAATATDPQSDPTPFSSTQLDTGTPNSTTATSASNTITAPAAGAYSDSEATQQ